MFSQILGQDRIIQRLKESVRGDKVASSYLFYGPSGVGKLTTAFELAKAVNCYNLQNGESCDKCSSCRKINYFTHPDVEYVFPIPNFELDEEKGGFKKVADEEQVEAYINQRKEKPYIPFYFSKSTEIRIDYIRMLQRKIIYRPHEGIYRVLIFENADQMNQSAANAFLKTLEEPPEYVILILTTTKINSLLPTIISRCQKVQFNRVDTQEIEKLLVERYHIRDDEAKVYARICNGNIEKAIRMAEEEQVKIRQQALEILNYLYNDDLRGFYEFNEKFSRNSQPERLADIFDYLILWLGDLIYLEYNSKQIVNIDKFKELKIFQNQRRVSEEKIQEVIDFLESAKRGLEGHINSELLLINAFYKIYHLYH